MHKQFICDGCKAAHSSEQAAKRCEAQGEPKYKYSAREELVLKTPGEDPQAIRIWRTVPYRFTHEPAYWYQELGLACPNCKMLITHKEPGPSKMITEIEIEEKLLGKLVR
ncbi:MAG: hypothetical protein ABIA11_00335 [Patescibacteria group bacterium]|nr:hypothetical protein [Patescibacteria group bacterium]